MIKVLLADDHSIVREGLRKVLEDSNEIEVIAEAANGETALDKAMQYKPDVAVIDISMPGMDGLEVVTRLANYCSNVPVLILTMHDEEQYVIRAIEAGAMGYVTKQSAPEQLVAAVKKIHAGGRYLTEKAGGGPCLAGDPRDKTPDPYRIPVHEGASSLKKTGHRRHKQGNRRFL